ncbi:hypothetical protein GCM10023189_13680 [Nibrella saemangeumensis]|uniref:Leucine-binding protein domain-containing protein n=1 Tax=Nibrella saemangeumensis TaxID=1084526 RepID=A0ABP8MJC3_9BACT
MKILRDRHRLSVGLLVFLLWQTSYGQTSGDANERRYKAAVRQVQSGQYDQAKKELQSMMDRSNRLAPYAHYYYAVAAFRQRNYNQARTTLKQLIDRFPDWRKMEDAYYLYASASMEAGQYEDALTYLSRISDASLRSAVDKLERHFFGQLSDLRQLKQLQREFPENRNLALALVSLIQRTSSDKADLELSDRLTNRFGAPGTASSGQTTAVTASRTERNRNKGYYNVAVLFPFRIDDFDANRRARNNQYAIDLYNGIQMAKAKLQAEGVTVNVFAYDLDNDVEKAREIVSNPGFAQTDLIFGPLYAEPNKLVTSFASENNMVLVNPLATSSDLIQEQPLAFLAQPSLERQADKTLAFVRSLGVSRKAAIYYGNSRKDSTLAAVYEAKLKEAGFQVIDRKKLSGTSEAMATGMRISDLNKPDHVFISTSSDEDGPRFLAALSRLRITAPVVITASAFDMYKSSSGTFNRRELYLLYPDFVDFTREEVDQFQENYLSRRNIIPSVFTFQGYDMMLFFGRQLAKNGPQVQRRSTLRAEGDDYLLSGFDYRNSNENETVPIVKFTDGRFIKVN